jgi:phosphoenolpyruvate synthase/pyruvate phosphate dikinase
MNSYVLSFQEIDKTKLMVVGGKGANLGELSRIEGIRVPEGFCVTTEAYKRIIGQVSEFGALLDQLSQLRADERQKIAEISGKIRRGIERISIDRDIEEEITHYLLKLGEKNAYAVRSSATAEDLPMTSFAGQQDTYLNIIGKDAILKHISKCWASLFTDRAVTYRIQNGFDHRKVYLSVVIQQMVFPQAAGILFTADPVTANRKVLSIDASFGLGEALVSGLVNADIYKVREGRIVDKKISAKKLAIFALAEGGTEQREIASERQNCPTLTDEQILQLERMGRKIEAYFSCPQDIEWCLADNTFLIVQSRPITTLYPLPTVEDEKNRVYLSFGHRQMMTEAIKPLAISMFKALFKHFGFTQMYEAGGRLFIDVSGDLTSPITAKLFIKSVDKVDILMQNALYKVVKDKEFMKTLPHGKTTIGLNSGMLTWVFQAIKNYWKNDAGVVTRLMTKNETLLKELEKKAVGLTGDALFDFILDGVAQMKHSVSDGYGVVFAGAYAADWLNKNMLKWLGEKNAAAALSQSVDNNVTSEMGLELLDVADVVRQYPAVQEYFEHAKDETFFADLAKLPGGDAVSIALQAYLKKYGMRCSGEIDMTRPRWSEQPTALIPMILSDIKNFAPNAHNSKFEQGKQEAQQKEQDLLSRLEQLPSGKRKVKRTKKAISVLRNFAGYREYNKYVLVWYYWIIKQTLLNEAGKLVRMGIIHEKEDIYYLFIEELQEAVRTSQLDYSIVTKRKADYAVYEKLTPPRVMTSEGEIITGEYDTGHIPEGALPGVPVSAGIVEGRARVVLRMEDARIEPGDILITKFTDPSWTPVFVSIKGLVTEVGGMMTHGAVVAREYGLPAVVSVENVTQLIQDGQRIRVNGTDGYVEILNGESFT